MDIKSREDLLLHWDDLDFQDFLGNKAAFLHIDGENGELSQTVVMAIEYDPNFRVSAHSHPCGHIEVILEGSVRVGDRWDYPGDIRIVPAGVSYVLTVGPEGGKALEIFPHRHGVLPVPADGEKTTADPEEVTRIRARLTELLKI